MRTAVEKTIGSLKTFTLEGRPGGPAIVLFHGYGADSSDLIPLADLMGLSPDVTWVLPNAPTEVIIAPGFYGRAWWPIDTKRLETAMVKGEPLDMSILVPPGLESARRQANTLYDELLKKHSAVILGGFSQGAMLATDLSLNHAKKPAGLLILSGTLINQAQWQKVVGQSEGLSFFQSHGKNDALLGFSHAEGLFEFLTNAGLQGDFYSFSGGHEIPTKVIEKAAQFVRRRLM